MKVILTLFCCLSLGWGKGLAKDEIVQLSEERRVVIAVPEGFHYSARRDDKGLIRAQLIDGAEKLSLQVVFLADPAGQVADENGQKDFLAAATRVYAEGSVEQSYDFKALEPKVGSGLYCAFTDITLAHSGKPVPAGEYLHATTGVKAWRGGFLLFTLLSNETTSPEFHSLFRLLKDSFEEKKVPTGPLL